MKVGRPTLRAPELVDEFCNRIASGRSVLSVASDPDMPEHSVIYRWRHERPEFNDKIGLAREEWKEVARTRLVELGDRVLSDETLDPQRANAAAHRLGRRANALVDAGWSCEVVALALARWTTIPSADGMARSSSLRKSAEFLGSGRGLLFADAVHPTHALHPIGCWAPKKAKLAIEQTSAPARCQPRTVSSSLFFTPSWVTPRIDLSALGLSACRISIILAQLIVLAFGFRGRRDVRWTPKNYG